MIAKENIELKIECGSKDCHLECKVVLCSEKSIAKLKRISANTNYKGLAQTSTGLPKRPEGHFREDYRPPSSKIELKKII